VTDASPGHRSRGFATSEDGTRIAYEHAGDGPPVVLVGGGLDDGAENAPLGAVLAERFGVLNYARRGRGGSGDVLPYAVEREIEDLDAVIGVAGGSACVLGVSSGGALALEAAAAGLAIERLAVYEVPYGTADGWAEQFGAYRSELDRLLADGRRGDAVALFMRVAGSSDEGIAGARASALWPGLEALAPTLAYDAACLGDGGPPATRLAAIRRPTLVLTGGSGDFFEAAGDAIAASVPDAERRTLHGQGHVADPRVLAATLAEFFA
jgi:pimeloyl-ACP methyl ester carboxylesterase